MKIEVTQPTLEHFFKDFYAVPAFQREYVWEEEQVTALLEDVYDALFDERGAAIDTEYFIGSVVVYPDTAKVYQLIDGQQRTTTLFIIVAAIRDLLHSIDSAGDYRDIDDMVQVKRRDLNAHLVSTFRVTPLYEDAGNMVEQIGSGNARSGINAKRLSRSASNMIEAYSTASDFLARFKGMTSEILRFHMALTQRVRLVRIETPGAADALRIFETINDRGIGLNAMDLLKNLLFMKASKSDYDKLTGIWKDMMRLIESPKVKEKPLRFLRYFIISKYADARRAGKPLTEDDLYEWLEEHKSRADIAIDVNPLRFANSLLDAAQSYAAFVIDPPPALRHIAKLSARARQHMVMMLASHGLDAEELRLLTEHLESLFVGYVLAQEPTKALDLLFATAAPKLRDLAKMPAGEKRSADFHSFLASWFAIIFKNTLKVRIDEALKRLSLDRKATTRFVLARIAMHLDIMARAPSGDIDRYFQFHVEHVLPNTPTDIQRDTFDQPPAYDVYKQLLGNLALLEESINVVIGRNYFKEKQPFYQNSGLLMTRALSTSQSLGGSSAWTQAANRLTTFDVWDSRTIEARQQQLADLAKEIWGFGDGTHEMA